MSNIKSSRHKLQRSFEVSLPILALLSLAIVFLPKDWLNYNHTLSPQSFPANLLKDNKGVTEITWEDEEQQRWTCTLDLINTYSYCSMLLIVLSDRWYGMDLSRFKSMTVKGSHEGSAKTMRVYLRNRHPSYYVEGDNMSTKYNLVEVPITSIVEASPIAMSEFSVADWWVAQRNVPPKHNHPEFNDVIYIEFQTGTRFRSEHNSFQIQQISWQGQLISDETLYRIMAAIWIAVIVSGLLYKIVTASLEIKKHQRQQKELASINQLLSSKREQLEEQAKRDFLTGTLNRLGIREVLVDGYQDWKQNKTPFSLMIIDLDHFKAINDSYGHDTGDQVLKACAERFKNILETNAAIARWGGEEFLVACKNTNLEQARDIGEKLRAALQEQPLECGVSISITASFGVASLKNAFLTDVFKEADEALYRAKSFGRNQVNKQPARKQRCIQ